MANHYFLAAIGRNIMFGKGKKVCGCITSIADKKVMFGKTCSKNLKFPTLHILHIANLSKLYSKIFISSKLVEVTLAKFSIVGLLLSTDIIHSLNKYLIVFFLAKFFFGQWFSMRIQIFLH